MKAFLAAAILGVTALWAGIAVAQPPSTTVVIVNPENKAPDIKTDDLEAIYLGKKTLWDGEGGRIMPALPSEDKPEGREFIQNTLRKSVSQYRSYWKRMLFSGGGAVPKTFRTTDELIDFVARTPGAIGVLPSDPADSRVKVLAVKP